MAKWGGPVKKIIKWYFLLMAPIWLAACLQTRSELSDQNNFQDNQIQVSEAQRQVAKEEKVVTLSPRADSATRLADVEESTRILMGKLEELEHRLAQIESRPVSEGLTEEQKRKLELVVEELTKQQAEIDQLKSTPMINPIGANATASDSWSEAQKLFDQKEYRKAILSYQAYREQNPKGTKLGEATYKIGLSFENLNMHEEAKSFYLEVTDKFSKTPEAAKAKVRLKKIK
jgi:tetratricopeptide (TPR) repeat protein